MHSTRPLLTQVLLLMLAVVASATEFAVVIDAFTPKGLRAYIRHVDGLEHFSFHGRISSRNPQIDNRMLSTDITKPTNGKWSYENEDVQLAVGDIIKFWIFLQYNGAGQRFDNLMHTVKQLTPAPDTQPTTPSPVHAAKVGSASSVQKVQTHSNPSIKEPVQEKEEMYCDCPSSAEQTVKMNTEKIGTLEDSILQLQNKISSLSEIVGELVSNMNIGTSLLLTGSLPIRTNPTEDVRQLIVDKLGLPDLSTSIVQAEYKKNGIEFEVSSSIDKLRILKKAKEVLAKAPYQIINADNPPFDIRMAK